MEDGHKSHCFKGSGDSTRQEQTGNPCFGLHHGWWSLYEKLVWNISLTFIFFAVFTSMY